METLEKIKKDIFERSKVKNIGYLPQTGDSQQEYDYRYVISEKEGLENYYFVVSKYIKFKASSISDKGFNVYIYDKQGNYIENPEIKKLCKGGFFGTLKDIK